MNLPKELTTVTALSKYLAMLVFVSLPIVGFFLGIRYQEMINLAKRQEVETNFIIPRAPTSTPLAIPTIDPSITANWKLYDPLHTGYSFKYPSDWIFQSQNEGCGPLWYPPNSKDIWWISVCGIDINPDGTPENISNRPHGLETTEVKKIPLAINGHTAIKREFQLVNGYEIDVYVSKVTQTIISGGNYDQPYKTERKSGTLSIYLFILDRSKIQEATNIFDQILSTFKFTK